MKQIGIIGGGCSGVLVAISLLRQASYRCAIDIFEPSSVLGLGIAYKTAQDAHLLNVPAARMGAMSDKIDDFFKWLEERGIHSEANSFMSRALYGRYLGERFEAARREAEAGTTVHHQREAVVKITRPATGSDTPWVVETSRGTTRSYDAVILALGLSEGGWPAGIQGLSHAIQTMPKRFIEDVWEEPIPSYQNGEVVAVLGSGLTAIDVTTSVLKTGSGASVVLVSRHGLLPRSHFRESAPPVPAGTVEWSGSLASTVRQFRSLCEEYRWDSVIDSVRPSIPALWSSFSAKEQKAFRRHFRAIWDVHRHRMAPQLADEVASWKVSGRLKVFSAKRISVESSNNELSLKITCRKTGEDITLAADALYNCTGFRNPLESEYYGLLNQMARDGLLELDSASGGVRPTPPLSLKLQPGLYMLGALLRGVRWESIAVPELRSQAAEIVEDILAPLH